MATLELIIVTPQRQVLETAAQWVELPAASGQMRVLPEHAPTLGELGAGVVRYQDAAGAEQPLVVSGGFFEVLGGKITLLADASEFPLEIARAAAAAEWEKLQRTPPSTSVDEDGAERELRGRNLAQARAEVAAR